MLEFEISDIKEEHYKLLADFYGRDLGGEAFFKWKHFLDPNYQKERNRKGIYYKSLSSCLGIFMSKVYEYQFNERHFVINLMGDLGISKSVKSSRVLIDFFQHAHLDGVDLEICYSDDRKIKTYKKIFEKYFTDSTQVIPFVELVLTSSHIESYQFFDPYDISTYSLSNNLGREKNRQAIEYTKLHPLYDDIHYVEKDGMYAIVGVNDECAEILDMSGTSDRHFEWSINVAMNFHSRCKILTPKPRISKVIEITKSDVKSEKPINMLIGFHNTTIPTFDPENTWVCRIDRR